MAARSDAVPRSFAYNLPFGNRINSETDMKQRKITIVFNSPVVLSFAALSLLVLVLDNFLGHWLISNYFCVFRSSLLNPLTYLRFFTHVLGHASYEHYINNMLLILIVGPSLEERYGSEKLLWSILFTAFITGVAQFIFFPGTALLGASGIAFMMIIMSSFAGYRGGTIPVTLIVVFALYIGQEVLDAIMLRDSVSQFTHVLGGICGAGIGFMLTGRSRRR